MDNKDINLTEEEIRVILLLRRLNPFGKLEVSMNQDGSQLSVYLNNTIKEVIIIKKK